jgi:7-cyano-7-deazaguanine reductase
MSEKPERRSWSEPALLKSIPNPSRQGYEIKIKTSEVTFLGVRDQPDFADLFITMYPGETVIELKSLKHYLFQFRSRVLSYERFINVIYDDLVSVYRPNRIRIVAVFNPRGGISSRLTVDSDWETRGGSERYRDWVGQEDTW